jgi:hypothetical protein
MQSWSYKSIGQELRIENKAFFALLAATEIPPAGNQEGVRTSTAGWRAASRAELAS